jgi:hypothetical protein
MFFRLEDLNQGRDWLNPTVKKDFARYRLYWKVAPSQGWSRIPAVLAAVCFSLAMCFLVFAALMD